MTRLIPYLDPDEEGRFFDELDQRRGQLLAYASQATPGLAGRVIDLSRTYPHLPGGVVFAAAGAGIEPDSPDALALAVEVAKRQALAGALPENDDEGESSSGILGKIGNVVRGGASGVYRLGKGAVRSVATTADALWQEAVATPIAAFGAEVLDNPFQSTTQIFGGAAERRAEAGFQSAGGVEIEQLLTRGDTSLELGGGFLPGGASGQEAARRQEETESLRFQGQRVTLGRTGVQLVNRVPQLIARTDYEVIPQDSIAFNILSGAVDAGAAFALDPAALALGSLSKSRALVSTFQTPARGRTLAKIAETVPERAEEIRRLEEAGGFIARRPSLDPTLVATDWLRGTKQGQSLVTALTTQTDPYEIWFALSKGGRNHIPRGLAVELAEKADPLDVENVLTDALGLTVRSKPTAGRFSTTVADLLTRRGLDAPEGLIYGSGHAIRKSLRGVRLAQQLPGMKLNIRNLDEGLETMHDFLRGVRLPDDSVASYMNRAIATRDGDGATIRKVLFDAMHEVQDNIIDERLAGLAAGLPKAGVKGTAQEAIFARKATQAKKFAREVTRLYERAADDFNAYMVDELANNVDVFGAMPVQLRGQVFTQASPHLYVDYLATAIPLPDPRALRQATSRFAALFDVPGVKGAVHLADFMMDSIWKPLALVSRIAWPVRVIGEEQARMAASGLDSVFSHPLSYVSWLVGSSDGTIAKVLAKAGVEGKGATSLGEDLLDVADDLGALTRTGLGYRGVPGQTLLKDYVRNRKVVNVAGEVENVDDMLDAWAYQYSRLRSDPIAREVATLGLEDAREWLWLTPEGLRRRQEMLRFGADPAIMTREGSDRFIESVMADLHRHAGGAWERTPSGGFRVTQLGDENLIRGIAEGRLGDVPLGNVKQSALAETLGEYVDRMPSVIVGQRKVSLRGGKQGLATYDRGVEWLFSALMGRPTNFLSRSPVFKQSYWSRMEELAGFADDATIKALAADARAADLPDVARNIEARLTTTRQPRLTSTEDASLLAKAHALEETKGLLYDLSKRGQFFDVTRNFFPFGEAWKEILTTWFGPNGIVAQHPQVVRRALQGVEGARESGLFFENDFGEESFVIPDGGLLAGWMFGDEAEGGIPVGLGLSGSVTGLNLFAGQVLPGAGPVLQVAAGEFIPDRPEYDFIREAIMPFGPRDLGDLLDVRSAVLPAWAQKFLTVVGKGTAETEESFNRTVIDVQKALLASGGYSIETPQAYEKLMRDAKRKAKWLWLVRAGGQFVGPTAPEVSFLAEDKDGKWVTFNALAQRYGELIEEEDGDHERTLARFTAEFGFDPTIFTTPKTVGVGIRAETAGGAEWEREHPDLVARYPFTVGLFAPGGGGERDYDDFRRDLASGARESVTPEQWVLLLNKRKGSAAYAVAKEKVGDRKDDDASAWLATVKALLREQYPGYDTTIFGLPAAPKLDEQIRELSAAVTAEPTLAATDAGQGLSLYLKARDRAIADAAALGFRTLGGRSVEHLRVWLHQVAQRIIAEHPEFAGMWTRVLAREVELQEQEEAA